MSSLVYYAGESTYYVCSNLVVAVISYDYKARRLGAEIALSRAPVWGSPPSQLTLDVLAGQLRGTPDGIQKQIEFQKRCASLLRTLTIVAMAPAATVTAGANPEDTGKVKQTRRRQRLSCIECTRRRQVRSDSLYAICYCQLTQSTIRNATARSRVDSVFLAEYPSSADGNHSSLVLPLRNPLRVRRSLPIRAP